MERASGCTEAGASWGSTNAVEPGPALTTIAFQVIATVMAAGSPRRKNDSLCHSALKTPKTNKHANKQNYCMYVKFGVDIFTVLLEKSITS